MFQLKSTIEKVSTLSNNCLSILIHTSDISLFTEVELTELFKLNNKEVWVAFKELQMKDEDLKIEDKLDLGEQKSPHKRLYDICLAFKKLQTGKFDGARELYVDLMNKLAQQILDKMEDLKLTQ